MTAHTRRFFASKLFIAGSLLALFSACAIDTDEGDLGLDSDEEVLDGDDDSDGVGTLQQAVFGNDCRNADIRVDNQLDWAITVKSVDYYNASEGEWRNEDLTNQSVGSGNLGFWMPDLNGSENDLLYSFNVNYECHGSHDHSFHVNIPDTTCISGRVFLLTVE